HDGERHTLNGDGYTQHIGCSGESTLPELVADHRGGPTRTSTLYVVCWVKHSSEEGRHPKSGKVLAAHPYRINRLDLAALRCDIHPFGPPSTRTVEGRYCTLANLLPHRIRPDPAEALLSDVGTRVEHHPKAL